MDGRLNAAQLEANRKQQRIEDLSNQILDMDRALRKTAQRADDAEEENAVLRNTIERFCCRFVYIFLEVKWHDGILIFMPERRRRVRRPSLGWNRDCPPPPAMLLQQKPGKSSPPSALLKCSITPSQDGAGFPRDSSARAASAGCIPDCRSGGCGKARDPTSTGGGAAIFGPDHILFFSPFFPIV